MEALTLMMNLREISPVCEFSGTVHVISDGSIVTSTNTFYKYMGYVIFTRRKPYLFIYEAQSYLSAPI